MSDFDDGHEYFDGEDEDPGEFSYDWENAARLAYESLGYDFTDESVLSIGMVEDPGDLRGIVFDTPEEALDYLSQFGAETWADLVYLDDGVWGIFVPESSE